MYIQQKAGSLMVNNIYEQKRITKKNIYISILLIFFIVFNPPIIRGLSFTILAIFFSLYVYLSNTGLKIPIIKTTMLFVIFFIYCVCISVIGMFFYGDISIRNGINTCVGTTCSILVGVGVSIWFKKRGIRFNKILDVYIIVGVLQAVLSILCFVFPTIKEVLNDLVVNNSGSEALLISFSVNSFRRNYGFASTMYDIFGCAMSLIAIVALLKAIHNNIKYIIPFLLIAFSAIINARTSIVLIAIGAVSVLLQMGRNKNRMIKSAGLLIIGIVLVFILLDVVSNKSTSNSEWLMSGINEIIDLLHGKKSGTFDALFNTMLCFPQSIFGIIFGTGIYSEQSVLGINSDIGYVRNIWQFGLIGSFLEYFAYISIFNRATMMACDEYKSLFRSWTIMIFIYLIKLNCFGYSMAAAVFLPILFSAINSNDEKEPE